MCASTINIGYDIQTLAAINFLKKKKCVENVICIDRESLSDYQGEPVTMIMNGTSIIFINFLHLIKLLPYL